MQEWGYTLHMELYERSVITIPFLQMTTLKPKIPQLGSSKARAQGLGVWI